jgi:hypothetical protein
MNEGTDTGDPSFNDGWTSVSKLPPGTDESTTDTDTDSDSGLSFASNPEEPSTEDPTVGAEKCDKETQKEKQSGRSGPPLSGGGVSGRSGEGAQIAMLGRQISFGDSTTIETYSPAEYDSSKSVSSAQVQTQLFASPDQQVPHTEADAKQAAAIDFRLLLDLIERHHTGTIGTEGKHIAYLIGSSGTGKSTALNYLFKNAKFKMEQVPVSCNSADSSDSSSDDDDLYEEMLTPVKEAGQYYAKVGNGMKSETRGLQCFDVDAEVGLLIEQVCDTPGFDDTGDAKASEVDRTTIEAANAAGIIRSMRNAKSARLILLVNVKDELFAARSSAMQNLFDRMATLIKDLESHLRSVCVLFTHCEGRSSKVSHIVSVNSLLGRGCE